MKIFALLLLTGSLSWAQTSAVGRWKTIDDETHKPRSIVEIWEKDGILYGKIESIFYRDGEKHDPVCDKCTDSRKDKPVIGMQFMSGFKKKSETLWTGGEILDPDNGKVYSCKMELVDNGKKLDVRGYVLVPLFGRSQIWERE